MSLRSPRAALALGGALLGAVVLLRGPCAPRPTRVLLVGDSITAGIVSEPRGPAYAELLPELLGPGFEIVNAGCGGATTLDWQPGAVSALCLSAGAPSALYDTRARPALPADFAVILLGTNDMRGARREPVEPDAYASALRALAEALHADGAGEVVLLSPPYSVRGVTRLASYRPRIEALCRELPFVHCGPDLVLLLDGVADFAPGDPHPNAAGHAKIAAALSVTLRERAALSGAARPAPGA